MIARTGRYFILTLCYPPDNSVVASCQHVCLLHQGRMLPQNFRRLRLGKFLTQAELARQSGLHALTISRLESGRVKPRRARYARSPRLCALLPAPSRRRRNSPRPTDAPPATKSGSLEGVNSGTSSSASLKRWTVRTWSPTPRRMSGGELLQKDAQPLAPSPRPSNAVCAAMGRLSLGRGRRLLGRTAENRCQNTAIWATTGIFGQPDVI